MKVGAPTTPNQPSSADEAFARCGAHRDPDDLPRDSTPISVTTATGQPVGTFTVPEDEREKRVDVVLPR